MSGRKKLSSRKPLLFLLITAPALVLAAAYFASRRQNDAKLVQFGPGWITAYLAKSPDNPARFSLQGTRKVFYSTADYTPAPGMLVLVRVSAADTSEILVPVVSWSEITSYSR